MLRAACKGVSPSLRLKQGSNKVYFRLTGTGKALGNTQLVQDKAYFEVRVVKSGEIRVGVSKASRESLDKGVGLDGESWGQSFTATDELYSYKAPEEAVIGCLVDQSDYPARLNYTLNGERLESALVTGMRGPVLPAVSLSAGAEVEVVFDAGMFYHEVPQGFSSIIFSQNFMF